MFAKKLHPSVGTVERITSAIPVVNEVIFISVLEKFCIYDKT